MFSKIKMKVFGISQKSNANLDDITFGIILSIIFSVLFYFIGAAILFPLIFFIFYKFCGTNFIIVFSILSLLIVSDNISEFFRLTIQLLNFGILFFIFIQKYGFNIKLYPKIYKPILYFLISFLVSMSISTIISGNYLLGFSQIIRTVLFFILVYFYYALIDSNKEIKVLLISLILTAFISVIILIYELSNVGFNFIKLNEQIVLMGQSFIGKNAIGAILVIAFSLATVFLFNDEFKNWSFKIILFDLLIIAGLLILNSRAAIGALLLSYLIIVYNLRRMLLWKFIFFIVVISPIVFINPINEYFSFYFRMESISTGRDWIFESTYKVIEHNIILGAGPGGTKLEFYKHIPYLLGSPQEIFLLRHYNQLEYGHAHNFYLFLFSDLGIPGLILSISLPIIFLKITFELIKNLKNQENRINLIIVGVTASGSSLFVRGFLEWGNLLSYGQIRMDLPFWILFCIILYYHKKVFIHKY